MDNISNRFKKDFKQYYINLAFEHYRLKAKIGYTNRFVTILELSFDIIEDFHLGIATDEENSFVNVVKNDFEYNPIFNNYKNVITIDFVLLFLEYLGLVYNKNKRISYPIPTDYIDYINDSILFPLYGDDSSNELEGFVYNYVKDGIKKQNYVLSNYTHVCLFGIDKLIKSLENSGRNDFEIYLTEDIFDVLELYARNKLAIPILKDVYIIPYMDKILSILNKYAGKIKSIVVLECAKYIIDYLVLNSKFNIITSSIECIKDVNSSLNLRKN